MVSATLNTSCGGNGTDEHHLVHFHSVDDELVQGNAHHQTHQGADEREQIDLPEDVAVDLLVIEAQHLDGASPFALAQVDADEGCRAPRRPMRQRRR